ncbi:hypothetical protein H4219_000926 [Mycoemilia scoparia]|uniref:Rad21/Rec8-like protein C-terminal eukaryotic domain-containing protein n=1 Tax=Mycoemilia scoparia TaxID=417184 RepID=A0A9W8A1W6_9FUNG|nr:hypothetical protein H4219_000926 [Mycoemilia scoparia]
MIDKTESLYEHVLRSTSSLMNEIEPTYISHPDTITIRESDSFQWNLMNILNGKSQPNTNLLYEFGWVHPIEQSLVDVETLIPMHLLDSHVPTGTSPQYSDPLQPDDSYSADLLVGNPVNNCQQGSEVIFDANGNLYYGGSNITDKHAKEKKSFSLNAGYMPEFTPKGDSCVELRERGSIESDVNNGLELSDLDDLQFQQSHPILYAEDQHLSTNSLLDPINGDTEQPYYGQQSYDPDNNDSSTHSIKHEVEIELPKSKRLCKRRLCDKDTILSRSELVSMDNCAAWNFIYREESARILFRDREMVLKEYALNKLSEIRTKEKTFEHLFGNKSYRRLMGSENVNRYNSVNGQDAVVPNLPGNPDTFGVYEDYEVDQNQREIEIARANVDAEYGDIRTDNILGTDLNQADVEIPWMSQSYATIQGASISLDTIRTRRLSRRRSLLSGGRQSIGGLDRIADSSFQEIPGFVPENLPLESQYLSDPIDEFAIVELESECGIDLLTRYVLYVMNEGYAEALKFEEIVENAAANKITASRAFSHILTLASRGLLAVNQAVPYGDISITVP